MKKLYLLLFWVCILMIGMAQADITSDLEVHYTFDNDDVIFGFPQDVSGNGNHIDLVDGPISSQGLGETSGFNFDGSDDFMVHNDSFDIYTTNFSVSFWIKTNDSSSISYLEFFELPGSGYSSLSSGKISVVLPGFVWCESTNTFNNGQWQHIMYTVNVDSSSQASCRLYVNSTEVTYGFKQSSTPATGIVDITFGSRSNQVNFYDGLMDEYRRYSRELSPQDVAELYTDGLFIIDGSSNECPSGEIELETFSIRDITTNLTLGSIINANFQYFSDAENETKELSLEESSNFVFCGNETLTTYNGSATISYRPAQISKYPLRYYINYSMSGTNETRHSHILYTIPFNQSSPVVVNVRDGDDQKLSNHVIQLLQFDESSKKPISQDFQITDQVGKVNFYVDFAGPRYGFVVRNENYDLLKQTPYAAIVATPFELVVSDPSVSPFFWLITKKSITADLTYSNVTRVFNFTWDDIGTADYLCLQVQNKTQGTLFNQCSSASSGFLNYTINESIGTFHGIATFNVSGNQYLYETKTASLFELAQQIGRDNALILSMFFFLVLSLISYFNPTSGVIGGAISLIGIFFLELLPVGAKEIIGVLFFALIVFSLFKGRTTQ